MFLDISLRHFGTLLAYHLKGYNINENFNNNYKFSSENSITYHPTTLSQGIMAVTVEVVEVRFKRAVFVMLF